MSQVRKCVKCNIERDSREFEFILYTSRYFICHLCHKNEVYIKCLICNNDYSEIISRTIKPGCNITNICHLCQPYSCSKYPDHYINKIFTILGTLVKTQFKNHEESNNTETISDIRIINKLEHLDKKLEELDNKLEHLDKKLEELDNKLEHLDKKLEELDKKRI
jgi:hypothetical protein